MIETRATVGDPCLLTVVEAAHLLGIGRTLAYQLIREEAWPTPVIRAGRLIRIPRAPLLILMQTGTAPSAASSVVGPK